MKVKNKLLTSLSDKKVQKSAFTALIALFILVFGLFLGFQSWNKNLYVSWKPMGRGLAGESKEELVLNLSSEQLISNFKTVLFEDIQAIDEEGLVKLYLRNLLIPNKKTKEYAFLCEIFSFVELSFSSLDISFSGEPGLMLVESPCREKDMDSIGPFFIPKKEILADKGKSSFEFEEMETFVHFYKASIALTPRWLLKSIRFFNKDNEEELLSLFDATENKPLEILWTEL